LNKGGGLNGKDEQGGKGKTLYIELSIFPGTTDPEKNLTIAMP